MRADDLPFQVVGAGIGGEGRPDLLQAQERFRGVWQVGAEVRFLERPGFKPVEIDPIPHAVRLAARRPAELYVVVVIHVDRQPGELEIIQRLEIDEGLDHEIRGRGLAHQDIALAGGAVFWLDEDPKEAWDELQAPHLGDLADPAPACRQLAVEIVAEQVGRSWLDGECWRWNGGRRRDQGWRLGGRHRARSGWGRPGGCWEGGILLPADLLGCFGWWGYSAAQRQPRQQEQNNKYFSIHIPSRFDLENAQGPFGWFKLA